MGEGGSTLPALDELVSSSFIAPKYYDHSVWTIGNGDPIQKGIFYTGYLIYTGTARVKQEEEAYARIILEE